MRDLNYQLKQLCQRNRDGSYSTQANRERILSQVADQLHELGFRGMTPHSLKPKHVEALVTRWLADNMSPGTIKNRMNCIRWWADKVDRRNVVARSNEFYGIPNRQYVSNTSKAIALDPQALDRIPDTHVRLSLELEQAFGLRREEAINFVVAYADRGDHLVLKACWTKGGKARDIPILSQSQRARSAGMGGDAIQWMLRDSGYLLAESSTQAPELNALLQLPLPGAHRRFEALPLYQVLELLVGPGFYLVHDPLQRLVGFERCNGAGA